MPDTENPTITAPPPSGDATIDHVIRAARGAGYAEAMNDCVTALSESAADKDRSLNDFIYELLNKFSDLTNKGPTRHA
jgi:hypothetical protein